MEHNTPSSRLIVADYINYRLERHGFVWENHPPLETRTSSVQETLRKLCIDFEERFRPQFSDMIDQLQLTPNTVYQSFHQIIQEVFSEGDVNWGRVLVLFGFGGVMAVDCVDNNMPQFVDSIVDWVSTYLDNQLSQWISSHGGWVSSDKLTRTDGKK